MRHVIAIWMLCISIQPAVLFAEGGGRATVQEKRMVYKTYPFSDPNPIAVRGKIYPYFRYDGFTDRAEQKEWTVVVLENDYVSVTVMPEIGGKVWSATDKTSGRSYIYDNDVVKFRDISLRGPWTSGGIEFNYGVVGHSPTASTPVDYLIRENADSSASCVVRMLDLLTRTTWSVDIRLPADGMWFETNSLWHNSSGLPQPYYNWTNSGVSATEDLEFVYPGTMVVRHDGTIHDWPYDREYGKDISKWRENDFLWSKSYHIVGTRDKYFGTWWVDRDFGMMHFSERDDKLGKKIFSWALSDQGDIWKELLTDNAGQYVELQSGRLFNQNMVTSVLTPYKQTGFAPFGTDTWKEYWFPYHGTGGAANATLKGVVNLIGTTTGTTVVVSPLRRESVVVRVYDKSGEQIAERKADWSPGKPFAMEVPLSPDALGRVMASGVELWTAADKTLSRPMVAPQNFNWDTAYGQWVQGQYRVWLRNYAEAEPFAQRSLVYDPCYVPGLNLMSVLCLNRIDYRKAFDCSMRALAVDTYDAQANYLMGCAAMRLGRMSDAMDGFEVAALTNEYRSAAYTQLAKLYLMEGHYAEAAQYARKSLVGNAYNIEALKMLYMASDCLSEEAGDALTAIENLDPLNDFVRFERFWANPDTENRIAFESAIRNEMAVQNYLELAVWYVSVGQTDRAKKVLSLSAGDAETAYWLAYLSQDSKLLERADASDVSFVFPFREESVPVFEWAMQMSGNWRSAYLLALVHYSRNNDAAALDLLRKHGFEPDFAPFYVTRASLEPDAMRQEADYGKAVALDASQWRYAHALTRFYMRHSEYAKALSVIEGFNRRKRGHFPTETLLVRALICNEDYAGAERVLAQTRILPFEGAKDGINLQRHIKLMLAVDRMLKKQNRAALVKIEEAKLWPRNLGVGKPYEQVIDTRLEDWLSAVASQRGGQRQRRAYFLQRLISPNVHTLSEHSLFQYAALYLDGDRAKARKSVDEWIAAQKDETVRERGKAFFKLVESGDYASDAALGLYQSLIRGITAAEDNRLF